MLAYNSAALCQIIVFVVIEQNYVCRLNPKLKICSHRMYFEGRAYENIIIVSVFMPKSKQPYQILFSGPIDGITKFEGKFKLSTFM